MVQRTGAHTSERILEIAARKFYERGYHAANMRDIAAEVGVRAPSLYKHFDAKQDLLFAIAHGVMAELLERGQTAVDGVEDPAERLRRLIEQHVAYHCERRFEAKVADDQLHALDDARQAEVIAVRDAYEALFRAAVEDGARGGWTVDDPAIVTFAITTMASSVTVWYREDGRLSPYEIGRTYADFALRGLAS